MPKPSSAKRNPRSARCLCSATASLICWAATSSRTWNTMRAGSIFTFFRLSVSQPGNAGSASVSCDSRTNRAPGFFAAQNDIAAPTTQRSTFFMRSLRSAAGMNTEGSTSWPCSSSRRRSTSYMPRSSPTRLAIGCCTRRKRFSIRAALMCLTQSRSWSCRRSIIPVCSSSCTRLPPVSRPCRCARQASFAGPSGDSTSGGTGPRPMVQVVDSDLEPAWNTSVATLCTTCSAQASTSWVLPRSTSIMKPWPPKRPARSPGCTCSFSRRAKSVRKSSPASTPSSSWTASYLSAST